MNKCKFLAMAAIAATVTMTSCNKGDEGVNNNDRVAVQFSAGNMAYVQTRVNDQTWAAGDQIGIYMVKETPGTLAAGSILENADNIRYNSVGGTGTAVAFNDNGTIIYYPVSGDGVKFIAYYPYRASLTDYKLPVDVSSQTNQSAIDVLYAPAVAAYSKTSPNAALPFEHKLVKLVFNISNGAGVTSPLTNALTVAIGNQQTTGELNLVDGVVMPSGAGTTAINALVSNGGATAEAIVLGGTPNDKFTFINAAGETFEAAVPDPTFERGKKYTYTVTLTKATAVITGSIAAWNTGGGSVTAQ